VSGRSPLLSVLASLAVHAIALSVLLLFAAAGEPIASALVIDLAALESGVDRPRPQSERGGSARPAPRGGTTSSAPSPPAAMPATVRPPVEPAAPVAAAPAQPEPTPPEIAPTKPEARLPEPTAEAPREEAPSALSRSTASVSTATANPTASHDQTSQTPGVGRGTSQGQGPQAAVAGSPSGTGPANALASGGPPGSEYGPYYRQIRQRIQETLEYPPAAQRRGLKGTVLLELVIKPDGVISAVVKVSSSHRLLDDAALETVRNLPRQPFPAGLVPRQLTVPLPVVFDLK
jgi:periplasmic protein TonB